MARTETMGRARKTPTCEKSGVVFVGGVLLGLFRADVCLHVLAPDSIEFCYLV